MPFSRQRLRLRARARRRRSHDRRPPPSPSAATSAFDLYSDDLFGLDLLRYHLGIYAGEGLNAWEDTIGAGDSGFLYNARLEVLPFGVFDEYTEVDFERSSTPRLSIGAASALLQSDTTFQPRTPAVRRPALLPDALPVVDFNAHNFTADFMLFWSASRRRPRSSCAT